MKNTYNLPSNFEYIIKKLDRLQCWSDKDKFIIKNDIIKIISLGNHSKSILILTKNNDYFISDIKDINGCLADRFNTNIFSYLELLKIAYPKHEKVIKEFRDWLAQEDIKRIQQVRIQTLREQAYKLGLVLVTKPIDP